MKEKLIELTRLLNTIVDWDLPELIGLDTKRFAERLIAHGVSVRTKGEWNCLEAEIGYYACTLCDHRILRAKCNFCPNCGADMRGAE